MGLEASGGRIVTGCCKPEWSAFQRNVHTQAGLQREQLLNGDLKDKQVFDRSRMSEGPAKCRMAGVGDGGRWLTEDKVGVTGYSGPHRWSQEG